MPICQTFALIHRDLCEHAYMYVYAYIHVLRKSRAIAPPPTMETYVSMHVCYVCIHVYNVYTDVACCNQRRHTSF